VEGLENKTNFASPVRSRMRMVRQRLPAIEKCAGRWPIQGAEQLQQSRFTASTRPRNRDELAFPNGKVDPPQGADLTVVEFASESFCLD